MTVAYARVVLITVRKIVSSSLYDLTAECAAHPLLFASSALNIRPGGYMITEFDYVVIRNWCTAVFFAVLLRLLDRS